MLALTLAVPAFALEESDVEAAVSSSSREAVAGNVLVWFLCAVGFLKVSQKIDSFMASIGVNVGHTGGSMLGEAMVAFKGVSLAAGAAGKAVSGFTDKARAGGKTASGSSGFLQGGLAGVVSRKITNDAVRTATQTTQKASSSITSAAHQATERTVNAERQAASVVHQAKQTRSESASQKSQMGVTHQQVASSTRTTSVSSLRRESQHSVGLGGRIFTNSMLDGGRFANDVIGIGEVYQLIAASSEQELNALFGVLPVTHPAKAPYSIFKQASEGVRGGVIIGLGSRLQVFQNRDIRNITSYNEIDLELPGKQPCAYYCITSDQDSTFDFLSSLFLSFVFIRLVRYADEHCPGGELPVPVHVLGEELCACGVIPDLSRKISVIRSRNLSMSCVFQNLAGLQNRYPYNQWQEILGNCDVQLFLGCTDALTAEFISDRTGEASISVTSKAKQLGTWRVSNYTPEYRETSGVGRRKLMTMDEVLRMDIDKALILIRGKNVLEVDKYDYSKHPEAKKLRPSKAASHVPAWRANQPQEKQTPSAPPSQAAEKKPAQKKKPAPAEKVVAVTKESIMKKKEDT